MENKIEFISKEEWFKFETCLAEPEQQKWIKKEEGYSTNRKVSEDGRIVWYGIGINWKKEPGGNWTELAINENAKPLEKYLPDIVYGEDRTYWKECDDMPIYEQIYLWNKQYNWD